MLSLNSDYSESCSIEKLLSWKIAQIKICSVVKLLSLRVAELKNHLSSIIKPSIMHQIFHQILFISGEIDIDL